MNFEIVYNNLGIRFGAMYGHRISVRRVLQRLESSAAFYLE